MATGSTITGGGSHTAPGAGAGPTGRPGLHTTPSKSARASQHALNQAKQYARQQAHTNPVVGNHRGVVPVSTVSNAAARYSAHNAYRNGAR